MSDADEFRAHLKKQPWKMLNLLNAAIRNMAELNPSQKLIPDWDITYEEARNITQEEIQNRSAEKPT